jgi:hypothetical protein
MNVNTEQSQFFVCGDLQVQQFDEVPATAIPRPSRSVMWLDVECGAILARLCGATELLELPDRTVIAVVGQEAAIMTPDGLPAVVLAAGVWGFALRLTAGESTRKQGVQ